LAAETILASIQDQLNMKPRVFIARPIQQMVIDQVARRCDVKVHPDDAPMTLSAMKDALADMDGLISVGGNITEEVLASAPRLRVVANIGAGYDTIDVAACTRRRVAVTNTPDVLTESTADFAFAMMLAVSRHLFPADRWVREGQWKYGLWNLLWGTELCGKRLGLYGFGRIGRAMARRAKGFSMSIAYYARHRVSPSLEDESGAEFVDFKTLLRESDFLSLHAPLNQQSTHAIGAAELAFMKPTAYIINTARGKIIDEAALVQALKAGRLAGAGLDVFENEPRINPALLEMSNVVIAPHIASATAETRLRMATLAAENLLAVFGGGQPPNILNPEVLE
jgi:lactate dehydrogenase-like 2-hydroxyacid dehydrogenase